MRYVRVVLAFALLVVACATPVERTAAVDVTEDTGSELIERLSVEEVLYEAPLIVEGTVLEVAGPFWNSPDGQKWEKTESRTYGGPSMYREISLEVSKVWRNEIEFTPFIVEYQDEVAQTTTVEAVKYAALRTIDLNQPFLFVAYGSGTVPEEGSPESNEYSVPSGFARQGDLIVVALFLDNYPMRDQEELLYQAYSGLDGMWAVVDEGQNSWVVPSYTLPSPPTNPQGDPMPIQSYGTPLPAFTALFESARLTHNDQWDARMLDPWYPERLIRFGWVLVEDPERFGSHLDEVRAEIEASLSQGDLIPLTVVGNEQPIKEGGNP